jgi:general stress protein 26
MTKDRKDAALDFMRANPDSQLATVEGSTPFTRVIHAARIDDDFTVWYATSKASNKVRHIGKNPNVCATFHSGMKWLRIIGRAELHTDSKTKGALWQDTWAQYWPGGIDDPDFVLLKIKPSQVEYFDTEQSMSAENFS